MIVPDEKIINKSILYYKKTQSFLDKNLIGFEKEEEKSSFIDKFMLQMFVLWYFQKKGLFNNDKYYFITKYKEIVQDKSLNEFDSYYSFFIYFLEINSSLKSNGWHEEAALGKICLITPAIFLIDSFDVKKFHIPDDCFYQETNNENDNIPLLSLFQDFIFYNNNIDNFVLGAIYEKLISQKLRKSLGTYYTPRTVTNYICRSTIETFLIEGINCRFNLKILSLNSVFTSSNQELIKYLFLKLKDIRILDPTVGVGHFLVTITEFLLELYVKVWNSAKNVKGIGNIEILVLDKHGNPKIIDLLQVHDENQLKFLLTYFIIYPFNIYGVDINRSAIQIAKARLLIFISNFYNTSLDIDVNLQNVFLNLKVGNTLLGYYHLENLYLKEIKTLDHYIKDSPPQNKYNKIEINFDLKKFLENANRSMNISEDIEKSIEDFNIILKKDIFEDSLLINASKMINRLKRFLLITSNLQIRTPLQSLLLQMKEIVVIKLNELFSEQYHINMNKLKDLQIFHWVLEFSEVFIPTSGFDIILANPPYLGESGNKEIFRIYAKTLKEYYEGKIDLWYLFLQRSIDLMNNGGYSSFISSNYWVTAKGAEKLRSRLLSDTSIIQYINFSENKIFSNAQGIHTNIIIFKKSKALNNYVHCVLFKKTYPQSTNHFSILDKQLCFTMDQRNLVFKGWDSYFHFIPNHFRSIIELIIENSTQLKKSGFYVKEGIVTGLNKITQKQIKKYNLKDDWIGIGVFIQNMKNLKDIKTINSFSEDEKKLLKPFYKNSDIKRFSTKIKTDKKILYVNKKYVDLAKMPNIRNHLNRFHELLNKSLDNPPYINRPRSKKIFCSPKIVTPHRSYNNTFAYNSYDWYAAQDVYYILEAKNRDHRVKSLLLLLNSKIAFFWFQWMGKRKGDQLEFFGEPLGNFPVPNDFDLFLPSTVICDYLLFLNSYKSDKKDFHVFKDFFENYIANFLVIELYFKRKLFEDGCYNNNSLLLQKLVLNKVKGIELNNWTLLHHKKCIEGRLNLNETSQKRILETKILNTIQQSFDSLKKDEMIYKLIKKLEAYPLIEKIIKISN